MGISAADITVVGVEAGSAVVVLEVKDMKAVVRLFAMAARGDPEIIQFFEKCSINPVQFLKDNQDVRAGITIRGNVQGDLNVGGNVGSENTDQSVSAAGDINDSVVVTGGKGDVTVEKAERIEKKEITIGAGSTMNAPVFIADDMENCFNTVDRSGVNDEVKAVLKELLEAVTEVAKGVEEKKAKGMVRDVKTLTDEVTSEEPNRRWYECSVEGLREAAKAVGKVGVPILTAVAKLGPLVAVLFA